LAKASNGSAKRIQRRLGVTNWQIFIIRAIMGVVFGVILSKWFYPNAPLIFIILLCVILVGLAYLTQYLRQRKKER
jgi:uncharacterized membrane protein HdeD (DUF308 family)